jgi:YD repeat-containing protein
MKHFIPLIIVLLFTACTKENDKDTQIHLRKITVNGKPHENFEYNNYGQLKKDDSYGICTVPSDEFTYVYKNKQLDSVKGIMRGLYSSTSAICNPLSGIHSYAAFEYDNVGRISKIKRENSTIEYAYNSNGQVEKQTVNGGGTNLYVSTFNYDSKGNLVETTNSQGDITRYEFDDKINPYFLMKRRPDALIAFYVSPNNVVKIKNPGSAVIEIKYEYNLSNMPTKMFDPNGLIYTFIYN